mmetsp:Transcript_13159/g.23859  ORF Transcript_13159/g.23859 Transcript_13159/m.23859 type:complete len:579 (-) Transcript_13159:80-1816(-)
MASISVVVVACSGCGGAPRGSDTPLLSCARCKKAWYHDAACQRLHYPAHKSECRRNTAASNPKRMLSQPEEDAVLDGMQVVVDDSGDGTMGKIAIATRDFSPLTLVLLEKPALVYDEENGYHSLFDGFLNADSETRQGILEMHDGPPLSAMDAMQRDMNVESEFRRYQLQQPRSAQQLSGDICKKLLRIAANNAHAFHAKPTGDMIAKNVSSGVAGNAKSALYVLASKAEHSCAPNLRFCTDQGRIRYTAEIPIAKGDHLSISYGSSFLQTPRKERREFLLENKAFLCNCSRCLGLDECSPLRCDTCQDGVMFQSGSSKEMKKWCCVSTCGWDASNHAGIPSQIRSQEQLAEHIDFLRESLAYGMDENTLSKVISQQGNVAEACHPLHWLHIAAWDLVSIVASSFARSLMMQGVPPLAPNVAGLLRLSAACQIHQILWTERNAAIVYGKLELKDAVSSIGKNRVSRLPLFGSVPDTTTEKACQLLMDQLCDAPLDHDEQNRIIVPRNNVTDVSHTVFHAGQDLLLAGHTKLACRLYACYEATFLRSHWDLSEKNKQNIRALVQSGGENNCFDNHLLAV